MTCPKRNINRSLTIADDAEITSEHHQTSVETQTIDSVRQTTSETEELITALLNCTDPQSINEAATLYTLQMNPALVTPESLRKVIAWSEGETNGRE